MTKIEAKMWLPPNILNLPANTFPLMDFFLILYQTPDKIFIWLGIGTICLWPILIKNFAKKGLKMVQNNNFLDFYSRFWNLIEKQAIIFFLTSLFQFEPFLAVLSQIYLSIPNTHNYLVWCLVQKYKKILWGKNIDFM